MEEESYLHNELHGRCRYYRPLEREKAYRAGERSGPSITHGAQSKLLRIEYIWNTAVLPAFWRIFSVLNSLPL